MPKAQRKGVVVPLPQKTSRSSSVSACEIARVASLNGQSIVLDLSPLGLGSVLARSIVDPASLKVGDEVLVAFAGEGASRPVVVGRLYNPGEPARDVRIRGRRIDMTAEAELVLRCASGTMRVSRDGQISVRGERIVTEARRTNRVRGGAVEIN